MGVCVYARARSCVCVPTFPFWVYSLTQKLIVERLVCAGPVLALTFSLQGFINWSALNLVGSKQCYMARTVISSLCSVRSVTSSALSVSYNIVDGLKLQLKDF